MRKLVGWFLFFFVAVSLFLLHDRGSDRRRRTEIALSEFRGHLLAGNVTWVGIGDDRLFGELAKPVSSGNEAISHFRLDLPTGTTGDWSFTSWLLENANGATIEADRSHSLLVSILVPLIPWLLIFGFIWFFVFRHQRNARQKTEPLPVVVMNPGAPQPPAS